MMTGSRRRKTSSEGLFSSFEYIQLNDLNPKENLPEEEPADDPTIPQEIRNLDKPSLGVAEAARIAVTMVGPRTLKLTGITGDKLQFFAIGCQGSGNKYQRAVASLMNQLARQYQIHFILNLGDIFYLKPPTSPDDPSVKTGFLDFYYCDEYPHLKGKPTFACLGNHEAKRENGQFFDIDHFKAEKTIAAITYIPDGVHFTKVSQIVSFIMQETHDITKFQALNIPFFYYAIEAGDVHIDCLNANSFLQSFLHYKRMEKDPEPIKKVYAENYQIPWAIETQEASADKFHIRAMHIPLFPQGKRAYKPDLHLFLPKETYEADVKELNEILGTDTECHSTLTRHALEHLGLEAKAHLNAHEHMLSYLNNDPIKLENNPNDDITQENKPTTVYSTRGRQICSGGGGGDRQHHESFIAQEELGMVLSNPGVALITIDLKNPKDMEIDFFALDHELKENEKIQPRHHLKFNLQQSFPIRKVSKHEHVEILRDILINASNEFLIKHHKAIKKIHHPQQNGTNETFLSSWTNKFYGMKKKTFDYLFSTYTTNDIDHIHDLLADLNHADDVLTLDDVQKDFHTTLPKLKFSQQFLDEVVAQIGVIKDRHPDFSDRLYLSLLNLSKPKEGFSFTR